MGNLLPMAKSISRRIRRDAGRRRHRRRRHRRMNSLAGRNWLRMTPIYYVYDDLAPVVDSLPLLIPRPKTEKDCVADEQSP